MASELRQKSWDDLHKLWCDSRPYRQAPMHWSAKRSRVPEIPIMCSGLCTGTCACRYNVSILSPVLQIIHWGAVAVS